MSPNLARQLSLLPDRAGAHLALTLISLGAGIALSLPAAVWVVRVRRLRWPVLGFAGVVQTIPSLALLALMVPLLDLLRHALGADFPAFGFLPAAIALTLYSALPILRNAVTGIDGVDPSLVEAASGLGMTPNQILWRVELPLAAPVILAGARTAAVWTVGMATLSTPVGQTSLGNYIFAGLQTRNWTAVGVGCVAAAALALLLDFALGLLEAAVEKRSAPRFASALGLGVLLVAGAFAPWIGRGQTKATVRIGAKNFTEQYVLASLMSQQLRAAGFPTRIVSDLGSTVAFQALADGDLDVYVDYSGTLWTGAMKRTDVLGSAAVMKQLTAWLERTRGIDCLGALGFQNAYGLAMREARAKALGIRSIGDLAKVAPSLTLGSDYEFFSRPEWRRLQSTYGLRFRKKTSFDPTFMYGALTSGQVDVITAFTTDGRIAADHLTVLDDPKHAFPPYDAVLLVAPGAEARWPGLKKALAPLVGAIDVGRMREANARVDLEHQTRKQAAAWLRRVALGR